MPDTVEGDEWLDAGEDGQDWTTLAGWEVPDPTPPHLTTVPAAEVRESLIGRRARFRVTSYDEEGHLLHEGWRDGLRVVSARPSLRDEVGESALMIVEESSWYRYLEDGDTSGAVWVGQSRIAIDIWSPGKSACAQPTRLRPALTVPGLTGRRGVALLDDGQYETDLRIVGEPHMTEEGDLVAVVVSEGDWYRWRERDYGRRHLSLCAIRGSRLWAEV